jgi:hypothetical protein
MCNPACEEERRIGYIARIPATHGEKISGMVQSHKGHHQAAQEINVVESRSSSRDIGTRRSYGPAPRCNPARSFGQVSISLIIKQAT